MHSTRSRRGLPRSQETQAHSFLISVCSPLRYRCHSFILDVSRSFAFPSQRSRCSRPKSVHGSPPARTCSRAFALPRASARCRFAPFRVRISAALLATGCTRQARRGKIRVVRTLLFLQLSRAPRISARQSITSRLPLAGKRKFTSSNDA